MTLKSRSEVLSIRRKVPLGRSRGPLTFSTVREGCDKLKALNALIAFIAIMIHSLISR